MLPKEDISKTDMDGKIMDQMFVKINFVCLVFCFAPCSASGQMQFLKRPQLEQSHPVSTREDINKIEVTGQSGLIEDSRRLQEEVARQFNKDGHCPKERLDYYKWIIKPDAANKSKLSGNLVGWRGAITSVETVKDGFKIKLMIIPRMDHGATLITCGAVNYTEEYLYSKGVLHYKCSIIPAGPLNPVWVW